MECPLCGLWTLFTVEHLTGTCEILDIEADGTIEFCGETEVEWDSSESEMREGEVLLFCHEPGCPNEKGATISEILEQLAKGVDEEE